MANTLARLTAVRTMLARARTLEDVKKIHDMAEAALTRTKAAHLGREAQYQAAEVALLVAPQGGPDSQGPASREAESEGWPVKDSPYWKAINDTGTSYRTAQRWQSIALVAPAILENILLMNGTGTGGHFCCRIDRASKAKSTNAPAIHHKIVCRCEPMSGVPSRNWPACAFTRRISHARPCSSARFYRNI